MVSDALRRRLEHNWEPPDFEAFFTQFAKRPPLRIKKGQTIFYEGDITDRIFFLKEGYVKMSHTSNEGRHTIIYLYGPKSMIGIRSFTSKDQQHAHTAVAMTDTTVLTISTKEYMDLLVEHPEYIVDLLHTFVFRLNNTERKLERFILSDTKVRVAHFLYTCVERFCVEKEKGIIAIPVPLTHQDVADFVGAFRETVTVALHKLEDEKIISMKRATIVVLNMKKLHSIASVS